MFIKIIIICHILHLAREKKSAEYPNLIEDAILGTQGTVRMPSDRVLKFLHNTIRVIVLVEVSR